MLIFEEKTVKETMRFHERGRDEAAAWVGDGRLLAIVAAVGG